MKTILITGGAGFIGSHLAKKLSERDCDIILIDRLTGQNAGLKKERLNTFLKPDKYIFYDQELFNYNEVKKIFEKHKFDIICHFAAKTNLVFNTESYEKNNMIGTANIFELAKETDVPKIIFASSSMVYGNNESLPFKESDNTDHPLSLYAATKKCNEILAYTYHYLYKMQMVGLRFFTTYGPWGRFDMSIRNFTEKIIKGDDIEITNNGKTERDFTYIDDAIDGIIAAMERDFAYELFNLGSGQSVTLEKIIGLIEKNLSIEAKKRYIPMQPGDLAITCADISKAKKLLDYNPRIGIEEGIKRFVEWFKKYR